MILFCLIIFSTPTNGVAQEGHDSSYITNEIEDSVKVEQSVINTDLNKMMSNILDEDMAEEMQDFLSQIISACFVGVESIIELLNWDEPDTRHHTGIRDPGKGAKNNVRMTLDVIVLIQLILPCVHVSRSHYWWLGLFKAVSRGLSSGQGLCLSTPGPS